MNMSNTNSLFNELKASVEELYLNNSTIDMTHVLRNLSKFEYYIKGDFESLWHMEKDENSALIQQITMLQQQVPTPTNRKRALSTESMPSIINPEEDDDDDSMPPLIPEEELNNNIEYTDDIWPPCPLNKVSPIGWNTYK